MTNPSKISMKKLAELCGVSIATVSRVVNQTGQYTAETEQKILEAIDKYDFTPNMVARSLKKNESKSIGIIVPDITNDFYAKLVLHIETRLFSAGYSLFICNTNRDFEKEKTYFKDLSSKGVDALICISGGEFELDKSVIGNFPIVCIDRRPLLDTSTAFIESDNYQGGFTATEELIGKGCKNILMIKSKRKYSSGKYRFDGYLAALKKHGIPFKDSMFLEIDESKFDYSNNTMPESAKRAIDNYIEKAMDVDGIFCANDWIAISTMYALKQKGIRIPEDVKIVGFDDILISRYVSPSLTTIRQDCIQLGNEAAEAVLDLLSSRNKRKQIHIVVPIELIRRSSS